MATKKLSSARKFLQELRGNKPLSFGNLLESIRLCDEISQTEFARILGISRAHLCDIEKNRRTVSAKRAAEFAKILQYSINQFVALALEDQLKKDGLKLKVQIEAA